MSNEILTPQYVPPYQEGTKKAKKQKSGAFGRFIRRTLLLLLTIVLLAAGALVVILYTIFHGPSETARNVLTMSLTEASATK
jgi:hypothetical protein